MGCNNENFIGKIKNVSGNKISVRLDDRIKSMMPIIDGIVYRVGQIGSFIKIPLGYTHVFAIVTQIGADAIPESLRLNHEQIEKDKDYGTRWLSAVLIGERVGAKFERGVLQIPSSDDDVHLVTIEDLTMIYGSEENRQSIKIGHISNSESLPAYIDIDKLVSRHSAILGATGSGKSNAVSVILKAIASGDFKSARILLIDPHGEYNKILNEHSKVFKIDASNEDIEEQLYIPYWALPFKELIKIFPGDLNEKKEDYLRMEILKRKIESSKYLSEVPREETITSDSPIPFSVNQLWFDLDDFERQTFKTSRDPSTKMLLKTGNPEKLISNEYEPASPGGGSPYINHQTQGIQGFLDGMKSRLIDQRYNFLLKPGDWSPDLEGKVNKDLDELLSGWIGHDKPITIIDLSGIPSEMMISMAGTLIKILYDCIFWGQNLSVGGREQPLLFVLEEAHNYLKSGENSVASRTVQAIAKEGRKYGAGLLLATQRASELDETVLSQCGTVIALRMTNNSDKSKVAGAVQQDLDNMINLLPSLRTGEAIISGEAVKIPCRVKFNRISDAPKSSDPKVSIAWKKDKPLNEGYSKAISLWRSGRLTENEKNLNEGE